jgi:hypothetical protein
MDIVKISPDALCRIVGRGKNEEVRGYYGGKIPGEK